MSPEISAMASVAPGKGGGKGEGVRMVFSGATVERTVGQARRKTSFQMPARQWLAAAGLMILLAKKAAFRLGGLCHAESSRLHPALFLPNPPTSMSSAQAAAATCAEVATWIFGSSNRISPPPRPWPTVDSKTISPT